MSSVLSPLVSEFESTEQEAHYAAWLRAKLNASLADTRPNMPHDAVMADMETLITEAESTALRRA